MHYKDFEVIAQFNIRTRMVEVGVIKREMGIDHVLRPVEVE